ncbi:LuxR C-terminal-related transcriptional regulator [Streptomyces sp. HU2014]|uniref:helix-turn-helix transcriptional regulator n=1 Tax=Streptomyces sp. HU2014 TaxID=2939414 RepID=UPI00200D69BA|nr:LuxR C-terminal-related transcriptional regulator [Streptomyces sp. HU2014]UQI46203.1 LuxR C-terminal-related transcriptional regulator [Streptomyces sp. HU2014]
MTELRELRLLVGAAGSGGGFAAVGAEVARRELAVPLQRVIEDAHRELDGVHERLASFTAALHTSAGHAPSSAASPAGASAEDASTGVVRQARARLVNLAGGCRFEVVVMLSAREVSGPRPFVLELLKEPLRNQARVRVLCPHTLRADAAARSVLTRLVQDGAEVRSCTEAFDPVVVFDGQAAFLPAQDGREEEDDGALTYEQHLVAFLGRVFERLWEPASPVEGAAPGYGDALGDLKSTILQLLASGLKDEVIARRVGMSSRTFRRHLAALMHELGAGSRFQAGVRAARLGLVS